MPTEAEIIERSDADFAHTTPEAIASNLETFPPEIRALLAEAIDDATFQADLDYVMNKNAELYRRLAD